MSQRRSRITKYGKIPVWFDNSGPECDVVVSTRIRLARNLADRKFPLQASPKERKAIFRDIASAFQSSAQFKKFEVINFARLRSLDQQFLVEERVVSLDLLKAEGDRGVVCDISRRVNVMVNEEDHLRLQCLDSGFRAQEMWDILDMMDDNLGRKLKLAYDGRRGFLTCCPTNSGTGLRVSFLMHLPGLVLTKAIDSVLQGASQMGISTRGFFGEHSDVVGNFFQLSNQATMGAHEQEFIDSTQKIIAEIAEHERRARERLVNDASLELSDKIYRSLGILTHARTLSLSELLNLSSALRLGVECGLYEGTTVEDLNRMIVASMPAHLQIFHSRAMGETDLEVTRAQLARELLTKKRRRKKPGGTV
ncbi:MAG: ATP--guanido phosphotransferase [Chitinispirillaceae bacterium]